MYSSTKDHQLSQYFCQLRARDGKDAPTFDSMWKAAHLRLRKRKRVRRLTAISLSWAALAVLGTWLPAAWFLTSEKQPEKPPTAYAANAGSVPMAWDSPTRSLFSVSDVRDLWNRDFVLVFSYGIEKHDPIEGIVWESPTRTLIQKIKSG